MLSAASYRKYLDFYCKPDIDTTSKKPFLNVTEIYHPFIKNPVCNSLSTDKPVLITGSNASGKSTFIKTLAINAILSQTIYTCLCERYSSSRLKVYSSMSLRDNLFSQDSYYMAEIKSLKRIVDADKDDIPVICFVDEVLRGTNTLERVAASAQILDNLGKQNTLCFAATHDIELTNILKKTYACYHFEENVIDDDVVFDYKLKEGPSNTRNAIKLLSVIGYDKNIIKKAEDMTVKFINDGIWDVI
ncbi:MAG: DNA mismatch repair protein MutS [Lachnospiraceae bacterium]|nr:DNA mismatch repair protein MutS [Lachnospiraceae bacterium]